MKPYSTVNAQKQTSAFCEVAFVVDQVPFFWAALRLPLPL
jgi:hypothetical protein